MCRLCRTRKSHSCISIPDSRYTLDCSKIPQKPPRTIMIFASYSYIDMTINPHHSRLPCASWRDDNDDTRKVMQATPQPSIRFGGMHPHGFYASKFYQRGQSSFTAYSDTSSSCRLGGTARTILFLIAQMHLQTVAHATSASTIPDSDINDTDTNC